MSLSRGRSIFKLCTMTRSLLSRSQLTYQVPKKWHGSYDYRRATEINKIPKDDLRYVEFLSAIFWWWVLWHVFTEYEAFIGESEPDPSKWTDEELGIPPLE